MKHSFFNVSKKWLNALLFIFLSYSSFSQQTITISGYVKEEGSQESLPGVSVFIPSVKSSAMTNEYGFYSITIQIPEEDSVKVYYRLMSYLVKEVTISPKNSQRINVSIVPENLLLEEVVISTSRKQETISDKAQMSTIDIPISQIKDIPALMGEKDVLKTLQLMPGVQQGTEGTSGIYVRGGGPDQNLIILDNATVYNAQHLFGFFSVFNGDAIKSVELTKGGFPARYGGRLSSVIDITMRDGNKEKMTGEVGVGIISSRATFEGPIVKNKSSFIVSGRRTYIDALTRPLMPEDTKLGYYFYDFNVKANYEFDDKNKLYLSGYFGNDKFSTRLTDMNSKSEASIRWGNKTGTLRWNHLFNDKTFSNASLIFSDYRFVTGISEEYQNDLFSLDYVSSIQDFGFKYDIDYIPNTQHSFKVGIMTTLHIFNPSAIVIKDSYIDFLQEEKNMISALESGVYIEDVYKPTDKWILNPGIRLSHYLVNGQQYMRPEPRFNAAYRLKEDLSLKASYASMNQYIHLLSNTGIGLPTDLWVPSTERVAPQSSYQFATGAAKDFKDKNLSLSVEAYYKKSNQVIAYKEGASFLGIAGDDGEGNAPNWQDLITRGQGWAYGFEFLLQRKYGKFTGWVGYTLSWTQLQFDSLNFGKMFYARFDRRHDISLVGIYKVNKNITLSSTWVYGTGNAVTMPTRRYYSVDNNRFYTSSRSAYDVESINNYRMPAYHRMDVGVQFHTEKKRGIKTWEFSIYNVYNRLNPFYLFFDNSTSFTSNGGLNSQQQLKSLSLFPFMPSFSYSFKFK